jgi:hypothetical protein
MTTSGDGQCIVKTKGGEIKAIGVRADRGIYKLLGKTVKPSSSKQVALPASEAASTKELNIWHSRLGHLHEAGVKQMANQKLAEGLPTHLSGELPLCQGCALGKHKRDSFPSRGPEHRAKEPLELVHTDLCGPMKQKSPSDSRYFITFLDEYTNKSWVYFCKEKSEAFHWFKTFKAEAETQTGRKLERLRSDNRQGEVPSAESVMSLFPSTGGGGNPLDEQQPAHQQAGQVPVQEWLSAMDDEVSSLTALDTWKLVPPAVGRAMPLCQRASTPRSKSQTG